MFTQDRKCKPVYSWAMLVRINKRGDETNTNLKLTSMMIKNTISKPLIVTGIKSLFD